MRRIRRRLRASLLGAVSLVATLAGCSSPDPVLYTIAPAAGTVQVAGPPIVLLDRIEIPRYLDRSQIVQSSADYRIDVKSNDWWGEPVSPMLRRILRQELTQRLPRSTVLSESGAVSATPDATIDLDLQRLDQDASGNVVLEAEASLTLKDRNSRSCAASVSACRRPSGHRPARSLQSVPPSVNSPMGSQRCLRDDEGLPTPRTGDGAAASGVSRLRYAAERPSADAGYIGAMPAMLDHIASSQQPSSRPHCGADPGGSRVAGRDVLDKPDERADRRDQACCRPVFRTG